MDITAFRDCLGSNTVEADIQKDAADASAMSILATPTFIVSKTSKQELDGELLVGAQPLTAFDSAIKRVLGEITTRKASSDRSSP